MKILSKVRITEQERALFNFQGLEAKAKDFEKQIYGGIAQLGEHLLCKQGVNGSIPFISTNPKGKKEGWVDRTAGNMGL